MSLGIGVGDEVITTPLSAVATTLAIISVGATPVFVDVNLDGQIDTSQIEAKITPSTKAILPVHLYGNACDITTILKIAKKHNLQVIEDAAQAHGSSLNEQKLGTFGVLGCFSFYPTKNLGTLGGDAGAIATNSDEIARLAKQLRNYGEESKYRHVRYGLNSRLDEIHAAVLRAKLTWLDISNEKKRQIASLYNQALVDIKGLSIVKPIADSVNNVHQYVIITGRRDELQKYLSEQGIPTLIHFPTPIHQQPFLKDNYRKFSLPIAKQFCNNTLSLPSHEYMTTDEINQVIKAIHAFFKKY
jgi:dTDP-4-amino-4,6-dideoxygalactose transaminase